MVERCLAKANVAGPNPVSRSTKALCAADETSEYTEVLFYVEKAIFSGREKIISFHFFFKFFKKVALIN